MMWKYKWEYLVQCSVVKCSYDNSLNIFMVSYGKTIYLIDLNKWNYPIVYYYERY